MKDYEEQQGARKFKNRTFTTGTKFGNESIPKPNFLLTKFINSFDLTLISLNRKIIIIVSIVTLFKDSHSSGSKMRID